MKAIRERFAKFLPPPSLTTPSLIPGSCYQKNGFLSSYDGVGLEKPAPAVLLADFADICERSEGGKHYEDGFEEDFSAEFAKLYELGKKT